ncbi:MAG TPA: hypothetical protein VFK78_08605 [Gemmatimonadales bacterium]|nr:hypothetical protein [Gemmatimonadales bacterium]
MPRTGGWWRLSLGTAGYILWAPVAQLGLPLVALLLAARVRSPRARRATYVAAGVSVATIWFSRGYGQAFIAAFTILVTAAFLGWVLLAPGPVWRQSVRATVTGALATALLARAAWGVNWWGAVQWDVRRQLDYGLQWLVNVFPGSGGTLDRGIVFASVTIPATLALQALAGLALAWQWHAALAEEPLGAPLAPFRQFSFGDHWVWGMVGAFTVWILPALAILRPAALNLGIVLGVLYLLRGAAIVTAFAGVVGISTTALAVGGVLSALLAVPLLFVVPGLWTLGIADTWLEFRRRLARRPTTL